MLCRFRGSESRSPRAAMATYRVWRDNHLILSRVKISFVPGFGSKWVGCPLAMRGKGGCAGTEVSNAGCAQILYCMDVARRSYLATPQTQYPWNAVSVGISVGIS